MENKLTDNEIKKALECCVNYDVDCKECPYDFVHTESKWCDEALMEDALDLINRLEAENNKLTSLCTSKDVIINSQEAEIEKLCIEINDLIIAKDLLFDEAEALIKKAKTEAVKEFAERVDKEITDAIFANDKVIQARVTRYRLNRYEDDLCIMCDGKIRALDGIKCFIDNALKETVGE